MKMDIFTFKLVIALGKYLRPEAEELAGQERPRQEEKYISQIVIREEILRASMREVLQDIIQEDPQTSLAMYTSPIRMHLQRLVH